MYIQPDNMKTEKRKEKRKRTGAWTDPAELWEVNADMARFHSSLDFRAVALSHRSGCNLYHMCLKVPTCIKTVGFRHFAKGGKEKQSSGGSERLAKQSCREQR